MAQSPAQIQRTTMLITGGVGAALALLFIGISGWQLFKKMNLHKTHELVTVTVQNVAELCNVESKSGKNWRSQGILTCEDAEKVVAEKTGVLTPWRSVPGDYALLNYAVRGNAQRELMHVTAISDQPVTAGQQIVMYADPDNPKDIERPYSDDNLMTFYTMCIVGIGIALFTAFIGWGIGALNRRRHEKALAAGGSVAADGTVHYPNTAVASRAITGEVPAWSKVVGWIGTIILVAGIALSVLALIAGASDGNSEAIRGAIIIAILATGIWALCRYIAGLAVPKQFIGRTDL